MRVNELSKEQMTELKCNHYCNVLHANESVSYGELANIEQLVDDSEIFDYYNGTDFVDEDFACTMED